MNPTTAAILELYKFDHALFLEKIGSLENDLVTKRVNETTNPILWIAGHITATRHHVLGMFGEKTAFPWPKIFEGSFNPETAYPAFAEVTKLWAEISGKMLQKIEQATESELSQKLPYDLPHQDNTVRGALLFFAYHESWHLGQISYIRTCLGLDGLVSR